MAQEKTIKTTGYVSQPKSQSGEINVNELAIMNIDDIYYEIDGHVAKFILTLIEDVESSNERMSFLESIMGINGES